MSGYLKARLNRACDLFLQTAPGNFLPPAHKGKRGRKDICTARVESTVDQLVDWRGGKEKQWEARIIEQIPDTSIVWESVDGTSNRGAVTFEPLGTDVTRLTVVMEYEPEGFLEKAGDILGVPSGHVEESLKVDSSDDIGHVYAARNQAWPLVDHAVVKSRRGIVVSITWTDESSAEALL